MSEREHKTNVHDQTISTFSIYAGRDIYGKILHMLLIIGRQEKEEEHKRTCLKKLSARVWNPAAWPPQIVVKKKPITRSKQSTKKVKRLPITMPFVQRRNPSHRYSLILRTKKRRYPTSRVSADADGATTSPTRDKYSQQNGFSQHRMTYRRRKGQCISTPCLEDAAHLTLLLPRGHCSAWS